MYLILFKQKCARFCKSTVSVRYDTNYKQTDTSPKNTITAADHIITNSILDL